MFSEKEDEMLTFKLPYPPSVNHYYGRNNRRTFINDRGKAYRQLIYCTLHQCIGKEGNWDGEPLNGDLKVQITIFPPDKRKRDMDNTKKALFDALQHAGLFEDDNQICRDFTFRSKNVVKDGCIVFSIGVCE
jgi:crossover junction endodeoxyribonuclease RusA